MGWTIEYTKAASADLKKLDRQIARRIFDYMNDRIARLDDPRSSGEAMTGSFSGCWRYRVGDFRPICDLEDDRLCVLVIEVGHRRDIYQ